MDVNAVNRKSIEKGMKKAQKLISNHVYGILVDTAEAYLKDMAQQKEFSGFTGNTQTSYSCGIYIDGQLTDVVVQTAFTRKPVRLKVPKGKWVRLKNPYEGEGRAVHGEVDVDGLYGKESAFAFLSSYKKVPKKGFSIVATTGTEYSEYIENVHNLNVMTLTWLNADKLFKSKLKPMKE